jgi:hypothetical protein
MTLFFNGTLPKNIPNWEKLLDFAGATRLELLKNQNTSLKKSMFGQDLIL